MREWGGSRQPELPEPEEVILGVSKELGLNPDAKPQWGYGPPVEQLFPEEAPSILSRRQALHCLGRLYYHLEWRFGADKDDKARITTQNLMATYELIREEQLVDFDPDYELPHVLGASKRHIAWLKEKRLYEETLDYNHELRVHQAIHDLLEEAVRPEEIAIIKSIEHDIRQYIKQTKPPIRGDFHAFLNHPFVRLLPEEADEPIAREAAFWCHELLVDHFDQLGQVDQFEHVGQAEVEQVEHVEQRVEERQAEPEPQTEPPIASPALPIASGPDNASDLSNNAIDRAMDKVMEQIEQHEWFPGVEQHRHRGQRGQHEHEREELRQAKFTVSNLLGATKRRLLYWHGIKEQQPNYHQYYQSYQESLIVYNLIAQLLASGGCSNQPDETTDELHKQEPHGTDDTPF